MRRYLETALILLLSAITAMSWGKHVPEMASQQFAHALRLFHEERFQDALLLMEEVLKHRETAPKPNHLEVAEALHFLCQLELKVREFPKAIAHCERALQIREAGLAPNSLAIAETLGLLGKALDQPPGSSARAEQLFLRALQIRQTALKPDHPDIALSLIDLAVTYDGQAKYSLARQRCEEALRIQEAALGKEDLLVSRTLLYLAEINEIAGNYRQAEPLYWRSLEIRKSKLPKNHTDIGKTLLGLGRHYKAIGQYSFAARLYQEALEIQEYARGPNSPEVAGLANNMGVLYMNQGNFREAETYYLRALQIRQSINDQPKIAETCHNIGWLYYQQGAYSRAKDNLDRALAIKGARNLPNDPDLAATLLSLAVLHADMKDFALAAQRYESALHILAIAPGRDHISYAVAENDYAEFLMQQGLYDRAEPLLESALQIRERWLGKDNYLVAETVGNLAGLFLHRGDLRRADPPNAESYFRRAEEIYQNTMGENYPSLVGILAGRATLRIAAGDISTGINLFARALGISELNLRKECLSFSESRLKAYLKRAQSLEAAIYGMLSGNLDPGIARLALATALIRKGRVIEELAILSRTLHTADSLDPKAHWDFEQLRDIQSQFAILAQDTRVSLAERQQRQAELEKKREQLDQALVSKLANYREARKEPDPWKLIDLAAAALPDDGVLVEIVAATPLRLGAGKLNPQEPQPSYVALVLRHDGKVDAVKLGPVKDIDDQVALLSHGLRSSSPEPPLAGSSPHRGPDLSQVPVKGSFLEPAQTLYRQLIAPLKLVGKVHVYLSPDGQLNLIPFAVLLDGQQFLMDRHHLHYLTTGRDLLRHDIERAPLKTAVLFGNPDFGAATQALERIGAEKATSAPAYRELPETKDEILAIASLLGSKWQPDPRLGAEASKVSLLGLKKVPGILHIATHGAFQTTGNGRGPGEATELAAADPMLQSRLLLAGANRAASEETKADGVATALELASMDLWGTQLVVLSACHTAEGTPELGQGVYGLRRAFIVAGAQTVVASLWSVDDQVTRKLMVEYYTELTHGRGRAEAMQAAMMRIRTAYPHPHYWAPFIVIGQASPLQAP